MLANGSSQRSARLSAEESRLTWGKALGATQNHGPAVLECGSQENTEEESQNKTESVTLAGNQRHFHWDASPVSQLSLRINLELHGMGSRQAEWNHSPSKRCECLSSIILGCLLQSLVGRLLKGKQTYTKWDYVVWTPAETRGNGGQKDFQAQMWQKVFKKADKAPRKNKQ